MKWIWLLYNKFVSWRAGIYYCKCGNPTLNTDKICYDCSGEP